MRKLVAFGLIGTLTLGLIITIVYPLPINNSMSWLEVVLTIIGGIANVLFSIWGAILLLKKGG